MKKLIVTALLSVICFGAFSQTLFPNNQSIGNATTNNLAYTINGGGFASVGFIDAKYTDTTQANLNSYLKSYAGARFYSTSDDAVWVRNAAKTMWLKQSAGGSSGSGWSLTGNSGTTAGTNFIGTTDSVDFVVKTNALERLRVNANGALGVGTGTDYGTAGYVLSSNGNGTAPTWVIHNNNFDATVDFSVNANPNTGGTTFNPNTPQLTTKIYVSTIDGSQWTWNGSAYVIYTSIGWNTFGNAGTDPTTNFIGTTDSKGLLFKATNTQSGYIDIINNNTSFGLSSLGSNTIGSFNSAFGGSSLTANVSGVNNTAIGNTAMYQNSSGSYNTTIGEQSLFYNLDSSNNIAIGYKAGYNAEDLSKRLYINSLDRTDIAGDTTKSIIYGAQDATADSQRLYLNSRIYARYIPSGVGDKAVRWNSSTKEFTYADTTSGGGLSGITVGTTTITSGTNTRIGYNNAGVYGEYAITGTGNVAMSASPTFTGTITGAAATWSGQQTSTLNGAASTPPLTMTGTWYASGTATSTKPQLLIEPTGATSTGWNTAGTGLGLNAATGYVGNLIDAQLNGVSKFKVDYAGTATLTGGVTATRFSFTSTNGVWATASGSSRIDYIGQGVTTGYLIDALGAYNTANTTRNAVSIFDASSAQLTWSSGTNTFNALQIGTRINTTGGTTTVRGIYYNPTLTSVTGVTNVAFEATSGSVIAPKFQVSTSVFWSSGTGSPEGVLTANIGSLYSRTDGGAGTSLYVKESGTGNTGWVAK